MKRQFGPARAHQDLDRYRDHGPDPTTQRLVAQIENTGIEHASLLDIGAGIGAIHHELIGGCIATATHVEAAAAYINVAREEAARRDHEAQVTFAQGDFVELINQLEEADVVTLDRVVCCYANGERLVAESAAKCHEIYALSYPRDRWYVKVEFAVQNLGRWLLRNPFRTFVHNPRAMEHTLSGQGFRIQRVERTFVWEIALYRRESGQLRH